MRRGWAGAGRIVTRMVHLAAILAQQGSPEQIRQGFGLLVIVMGLGVGLIVIAGGLAAANRRRWQGRRKRRGHTGLPVDAWREAGARAHTPSVAELEMRMGRRFRRRRHDDRPGGRGDGGSSWGGWDSGGGSGGDAGDGGGEK